MLGCCSSFKKCSDAGRCIHETDTRLHGVLDYENCLYKENIDKGLNFYTEYNDNNRARAEKYKAQIEQDVKETTSISMQNKQKNKTYIEIFNRIYSIGKRSDYKGYTYDLSKEEREQAIAEFLKYDILCTDTEDTDKFIDENIENNELCNCKIVVILNKQKYNIANYNNRGLKKETAIEIADFLIQNKIEVEIEEINNFSGSKTIKTFKQIEKQVIKNEEKQENISDYKQISLFDM